MSNPNPPAPRALLAFLLLALAGYVLFLQVNTTTVAGGADSSGYLNSARLLAGGQLQAALRTPPAFGPVAPAERLHFTPHGFFPTPENPLLPPTYPSGLPLHYALAGKLLGWTAGPLVVALGSAALTLILFYLVARELSLPPALAAAGAAALAVFPPLLFAAIQPLSDVLATAWTLAAALAALRARRSSAWAAASGAALAIAVLVRPTNLLLLPALLLFLKPGWRRLALFLLAGLPGAVWLACYNHALYGGVFRSGYPAIATAFSTDYAWPTVRHFTRWLATFLPAVLLLLPLAALARRSTRSRELLALAVWFAALAGPYVFYAISQEDWSCLRFILPALPALVLAALLGVNALTPSSRLRTAAAVLLAAWALAGSWHWTSQLGILYIKGYEQPYAAASLAARATLPAHALVVSGQTSGALYFYTDLPVLRWDFINATDFARYSALAQKTGTPLYAALFNTEETAAFGPDRCPGEWTKISTHQSISLWRLIAAAPPPATAAK